MRVAIVMLAVALAGCGRPEPEREAERVPEPVATQAAAPPVVPTPTPAPSSTPAPAPTPAKTEAKGEIPIAWRGIWATTPADCAGGEGRLAIDATRLTFYESAGRTTGIERLSEREVQLDLAMSGEGDSWTRRAVLSLTDDADGLRRAEAGMPTVVYTRCRN